MKVEAPNGGLQRHAVEPLDKRDDSTSNVAAILDSLAAVDQQDAQADKEEVDKGVSGLPADAAMATAFGGQSKMR